MENELKNVIFTIKDMARREKLADIRKMRPLCKEMERALNQDGGRYAVAFFEDKTPRGTAESEEITSFETLRKNGRYITKLVTVAKLDNNYKITLL